MADITSYSGLSRKQIIWTIIGLQITLLLAAIDQTIVAPAMPRITAELSGFERYAWVMSAYLLTSTAMLPVFGRLSDMYGRKWILLFGAVGFVIASALCGMAGNIPLMPGDGMTQLILCRGLQGIAGGAVTALVFTVVGDLFAPADRGKYQGLFSAVWALASVLGPVGGGWLTDHLSWRWVFYVNLPVGLVAVLVLYFAFPAKIREHAGGTAGRQHKLDILGVLTLVGWVVPLMLGLTWAPEQGVLSPNVVLAFIVSAVLFVAFIIAELKHPEPIVPLSLFRNNIILLCSISGLMIAVAMFGCVLFLPLYFQAVQGATASASGYMMLPMMLTITIASIVSGQLIARTGKYKSLAIASLVLLGAGMFGLSTLRGDSPWMVSLVSMVLVGIGLGFSFPVYTIAGQNAAGERQTGVVTGVLQFARSIGGTVGSAIFNSVLLSYYGGYLERNIPNETPDEVRALLENPLKLYEGGQAGLAKLTGSADQILPVVQQALMVALHNIFLYAAIVIAIGIVLNFFLKELPLRKHAENVNIAPADPELV